MAALLPPRPPHRNPFYAALNRALRHSVNDLGGITCHVRSFTATLPLA